MPRKPKTPSEAYKQHERDTKRKERAAKRADAGLEPLARLSGAAEKRYQADLEARGQLTIDHVIQNTNQGIRHAELQALSSSSADGQGGLRIDAHYERHCDDCEPGDERGPEPDIEPPLFCAEDPRQTKLSWDGDWSTLQVG